MKKLLNQGMVDCTNCQFGCNGNDSCGDGQCITAAGKHGCGRGLPLQVMKTPVQEFKEQMMMPGLQPSRRAGI